MINSKAFFTIISLLIFWQSNLSARVTVTSITGEIEFNYIFTKSTLEFIMQNDAYETDAEFTCSFQADRNSFIKDMWLTINGKYEKGESLERWTATRIYDRIVGRKIDPSLLTTDQSGYYTLRVFPFKPNEIRRVKIELFQPLQYENNHYNWFFNYRNDLKTEFNLTLKGKLPGIIVENQQIYNIKRHNNITKLKLSNPAKLEFLSNYKQPITIEDSQIKCIWYPDSAAEVKPINYIEISNEYDYYAKTVQLLKENNKIEYYADIFGYYDNVFMFKFNKFLIKNKNINFDTGRKFYRSFRDLQYNHTKIQNDSNSGLLYSAATKKHIKKIFDNFKPHKTNSKFKKNDFLIDFWRYYNLANQGYVSEMFSEYLTAGRAKLVIEKNARSMQIYDEETSRDREPTPLPPPPPPSMAPVYEEEIEFFAVQDKPYLIGGYDSLSAKLVYPPMARKQKINGQVIIRFVVSKDGNPEKFSILFENPQNLGFGDAAKNAIKQCRFKPGYQADKTVPVNMVLPVTFITDSTKKKLFRTDSTLINQVIKSNTIPVKIDTTCIKVNVVDKKFTFTSISSKITFIEDKLDIGVAEKLILDSDQMYELIFDNLDYLKYFNTIYDYMRNYRSSELYQIGIVLGNRHYLFVKQ